MFEIFEKTESNVRSYCRKYPVIFSHAKNAELFSNDGTRYIDFLAVAGSMNFGHNNPEIKGEVIEYLKEDHIINALDMYTVEKEQFFRTFYEKIIKRKGMDYKVMCCGPTGTNAVEGALKLARKCKKRTNIFAFSGAFHGMTLGSLSLTSDRFSRGGAGIPLNNVCFIPYENNGGSIEYLEYVLTDDHSGIEKPAAIILETVQAEGGVNVASCEWLKKVRQICDEHDILMIVDDIQVGVGRTGSFFSFERAGIMPDMVILSKSISGFGMPMSLLLIKPEYDIFQPAEHNGTFRGFQLSFVGATASVNYFLKHQVDVDVKNKEQIIREFLKNEIVKLDERIEVRGIGMIWGVDMGKVRTGAAVETLHKAFENNIIVEVAGRGDSVVKIMPPLTIEEDILIEGLQKIKNSIEEVISKK